MYDSIRSALDGDEFSVVERFEVPGRTPEYAPVPKFLFDSRSRVGLHIGRQWGGELWAHQAQALDALGRGDNVVVSTSTASGKSLIFRSFAFHTTLLNPRSRVLVFYPLKALAGDQIRGWREMARSLGLEETYIGRIDGSVPVREREDVLRRSRIVVMTPDVCHAWLMSRLSLPVIRAFVQALTTIVMDEAHTLEGVFGSNFSFLIRRLIFARDLLLQDKDDAPPLRFIAATATIRNPGEHLKQLTGAEFSTVDHEADGAPQHERIIAHVACEPDEEIRVAKALHDCVLENGREGAFITFVDSRKGVERLAMASGAGSGTNWENLFSDSDVLPYRAGYDAEDRQRIEQRLRSGNLRGVVSTSALELGIDIPHFRVGFNAGVPATRKAYRQRLGRVGRNGAGAFVMIAPANAFRRFGTSFREYHEMSVEPSYLYLNNRFMQFAHARCLTVELESLGVSTRALPGRVTWPPRFDDTYMAARPEGRRPQEFDAIAILGGDMPHYNYPLRNVGEVSYQIKTNKNGDSIGEVTQLQALRECYPGATYLHLARAYKVNAWHTSSLDPFIRVKPMPRGGLTRPKIKTWINAGVTPGDVQEHHLRRSESGFLAECLMQITEKVEGYVDVNTNAFHPYQNLQQRNPNMRARFRNFRTTGVVLCIERDWFKGSSLKRPFVDRLREVFVREYSVSSRDVGSAGARISAQNPDGRGLPGSCVAVYDETYGSLRLTEQLYLKFEHVLARMSDGIAAEMEEDDEIGSFVARIREEVSAFTDEFVAGGSVEDLPTGYEQVFTRGSRVCHQQGQIATDVEIVQPTMMDGRLMYQIRIAQRPGQRPGLRWLPASSIEPSADADAWSLAWWNRETQRYEELPDGEDS